jgi:hypothetical protein
MKMSEIIIDAWQQGRISEGKAARMLGVDRLTLRTMRDNLLASEPKPSDEAPFCLEHECPMDLVDYDDGSRYECNECQRERGEALGLE